MGKAIGIDLGTTNSVVAYKDTETKILQNKENEELTRSCVIIDKGVIVVGKYAYDNMKKDPQNTILSIKRLMGGGIKDEMVQHMKASDYYKFGITNLQGGTDEAVTVLLGGKQWTPEAVSAEILKKLKNDAEAKLGGEVTHAVITVPAYFTEKQKNATRKAAFIAGFKVQQLLAEPTAAAIAYGVDSLKPGECKTVLIYDFGGGTFDLSILNIADGLYSESGTGGDRWLGGDDIDRKIHELVNSKVEKEYNISDISQLVNKLSSKKKNKFEAEMRIQVEEAKKQLSSTESASIQIDDAFEDENNNIIDINVNISRDEFEDVIRPFVQRTIDLIEELFVNVGFDINVVDHILLVGGTSCIPLVKEMLIAKFGKDKIMNSEKPMLGVAQGAAILAHKLTDEFECPGCGSVIKPDQKICHKCNVDVEKLTTSPIEDGPIVTTSHNYFIQLLKDGEHVINNDSRIIDANEPLSFSKSQVFRTTTENQKIVELRLFTDIENGNYNQIAIGFFTIEDNLPDKSELVFNFELNGDEILSISAYPKNKKNKEQKIVLGRGGKDSNALEFIAESVKFVLSSVISSSKKEEFLAEIQKEIIKVNKIGVNNPDSDQWEEIKASVQIALVKSKLPEEDNPNLPLVFAQILCANYQRLIDNTDYTQMQGLINKYNATSNSFEQQKYLSELKTTTDGYGDLIFLFLFKLAATAANDANPSEAVQLNNAHNKVFDHFKNGDSVGALRTMNETFGLAKKYLTERPFSGGGLGLGKN
jgi:molecular chaperone DnaK